MQQLQVASTIFHTVERLDPRTPGELENSGQDPLGADGPIVHDANIRQRQSGFFPIEEHIDRFEIPARKSKFSELP